VFLGVNTLNLDAKGRMAIPAKYRDELADCCASRVVVTISPSDKCLLLYPDSEWREIARKVSRLPNVNRQNRLLQRLLLGHATELEMDGQGRILLAPALRDYASLDKRVAVVGEGHRFEIWNEQTWLDNREGWLAEAGDPNSVLSDELAELSL
jgi:MraZ protein